MDRKQVAAASKFFMYETERLKVLLTRASWAHFGLPNFAVGCLSYGLQLLSGRNFSTDGF
jgi:hypothetical protein